MRLAIDLTLAGQQRDRAHLAQVEADGVVGLGAWLVDDLLLLLLFLFLFDALFFDRHRGLDLGVVGRLLRVDDLLDVVVAEHRHDVVELIGSYVAWQATQPLSHCKPSRENALPLVPSGDRLIMRSPIWCPLAPVRLAPSR